ncbi:hypothetical protein ElyMa_004598700 [Elysia marginata]|uniref:Uncharacterized protein n=1 Tax=Elysia marginata TaxID=1093978 RepID=A0AAV4HV78_9GAST|nr:hypothetical protein ElyMa_004598700 [Elysia marginata]
MEYGNTASATAAKTNTTRLCKVQNAGPRLITEAMKTIPIEEMERYSNISPLDNCRHEKIYAHSEKLKRLQTHPMHRKPQEPLRHIIMRFGF